MVSWLTYQFICGETHEYVGQLPVDAEEWTSKGSSDASEEPGAVRLVLSFSHAGSLEGAWVYRHWHFVASE